MGGHSDIFQDQQDSRDDMREFESWYFAEQAEAEYENAAREFEVVWQTALQIIERVNMMELGIILRDEKNPHKKKFRSEFINNKIYPERAFWQVDEDSPIEQGEDELDVEF